VIKHRTATATAAVALFLTACASTEPAPAQVPATTAPTTPAATTPAPSPSPTTPTSDATELPPPALVAVPSVVGMDLQSAQEKLFPPLRSSSVDATGAGRAQVVDGNWIVVRQEPAAGTRVPPLTSITLYVRKNTD
jgi:glucose/arabinose dehydrogenase